MGIGNSIEGGYVNPFLNPSKQFIGNRFVREAPLKMDEAKYYEKFIEGIGLSDEERDELAEKRSRRIGFDDMREFASFHGEDKITRDIEKIRYLREKNGQKYKTGRAEILERLMERSIEDADWFDGGSIYTTLEYDDRINHMDFVIEWDGDGERDDPIYLGLDMTVSENEETLNRKADYIKGELEANRLGRIDYYKSDMDGEMKSLKNIPRVVLPLEKESLDELCGDALQDKNGNKLSKNYNQLVFIKSIIKQLKWQLSYVKDKKFSFRKKLQSVLEKMEVAYEDKKNSLGREAGKRAGKDLNKS